MKRCLKSPLFWGCISFLILLGVHVGITTWIVSEQKTKIDKLEEELAQVSEGLGNHIIDTTLELDLLHSKYETLDNVISADDKRKIQINATVAAIKEHLQPRALCPATLHSGELLRIASAVVDLSNRYAVPAALTLGVIQQESSFCRKAVSPVGAQGYMQLMPETAKQVSNEIGIALNVWNSRDNIHLGIAYLSQLLTMFNGDIDLAVKAYNGGPQHVQKVQAGIYKEYYKETAEYAVKVQEFMKEFERFGITW